MIVQEEGTIVTSLDNSVPFTCATVVGTLLFGSCWFSIDIFLITVALSKGCSIQQNKGGSFSKKNTNYRID